MERDETLRGEDGRGETLGTEEWKVVRQLVRKGKRGRTLGQMSEKW